MAKELLIDFFDCNVFTLNDIETIKKITRKIVKEINSIIVEETWHCFSPVGITYVANHTFRYILGRKKKRLQ